MIGTSVLKVKKQSETLADFSLARLTTVRHPAGGLGETLSLRLLSAPGEAEGRAAWGDPKIKSQLKEEKFLKKLGDAYG